MQTELGLIPAEQCLDFTETVLKQGRNEQEKDPDKIPHELLENLEGFRNFLSLSVNAKIEKIIIPQRYERVYRCIYDTAMTSFLAEKAGIDPVMLAILEHAIKNIQKGSEREQ